MKLKEFKTFILSLPEKFDEFSVVNGEGFVNEDKTFVMVNNTIINVYVDEKTKELQLLHQTPEDIKNLFKNGDTKKS